MCIVLYDSAIVAGVLGFVSFFTILFTKRNPFVDFQAMVLRYTWRVVSFVYFMRDEYPPVRLRHREHGPRAPTPPSSRWRTPAT